jgi:D-glycero-D-manno-heptose 1,7-bisphosphate phosphatase
MHKALFLDRDGVVNHEVGYLSRSADVRWMEGLVPLCLTAQAQGYKIVVITNQSGIGRGLYSEDDFQTLMRWMRAELSQQGVTLDGVYHCAYHPTEGLGEYKREHEDRKPSPGMILRAAREHELDLASSILIGDRCSDIAAANAGGLRQAFLIAGTETSSCAGVAHGIASLDEVRAWLLQHD